MRAVCGRRRRGSTLHHHDPPGWVREQDTSPGSQRTREVRVGGGRADGRLVDTRFSHENQGHHYRVLLPRDRDVWGRVADPWTDLPGPKVSSLPVPPPRRGQKRTHSGPRLNVLLK